MFCDSGKAEAFFNTGLTTDNPWNQVQLDGTFSATTSTASGSIYLDESGNSANGTFTLTKED
jgi:hypothetical protein